MPIKLIRLSVEDLTDNFNSVTIALMCTHICSRLLMNMPFYSNASHDDKSKILGTIEKIRAYSWSLEKFEDNIAIGPVPAIEIMCISLLHNSPDEDGEVMLAQFDLSKEGLVGIHPTNVLTFLFIAMKEGAESLKSRSAHPERLDAAFASCIAKFTQIITEIAPIIGANQRWYQAPLPISENTSALLRVRYN